MSGTLTAQSRDDVPAGWIRHPDLIRWGPYVLATTPAILAALTTPDPQLWVPQLVAAVVALSAWLLLQLALRRRRIHRLRNTLANEVLNDRLTARRTTRWGHWVYVHRLVLDDTPVMASLTLDLEQQLRHGAAVHGLRLYTGSPTYTVVEDGHMAFERNLAVLLAEARVIDTFDDLAYVARFAARLPGDPVGYDGPMPDQLRLRPGPLNMRVAPA